MERNWKKELRTILIKNNMSEEYIEETLEYTDDERMDDSIYDSIVSKPIEEEKVDADVPSCWSNLKNNEYIAKLTCVKNDTI